MNRVGMQNVAQQMELQAKQAAMASSARYYISYTTLCVPTRYILQGVLTNYTRVMPSEKYT